MGEVSCSSKVVYLTQKGMQLLDVRCKLFGIYYYKLSGYASTADDDTLVDGWWYRISIRNFHNASIVNLHIYFMVYDVSSFECILDLKLCSRNKCTSGISDRCGLNYVTQFWYYICLQICLPPSGIRWMKLNNMLQVKLLIMVDIISTEAAGLTNVLIFTAQWSLICDW